MRWLHEWHEMSKNTQEMNTGSHDEYDNSYKIDGAEKITQADNSGDGVEPSNVSVKREVEKKLPEVVDVESQDLETSAPENLVVSTLDSFDLTDDALATPVDPDSPDELTQEEYQTLNYESQLSLAQRLRPKSLEDYIGQVQLLGENGTAVNYFKPENIDNLRSLIFWGPPGVGKTSLAKIIIKKTKYKYHEFSASIDSISQIKPVIEKLEQDRKYTANLRNPNKIILFIDEIHRFSKTQQDYLLDLIDRNFVVLIGATTENPSFNLTRPLCSRCVVLILKSHTVKQVEEVVKRGIEAMSKTRKYIFNYPRITWTDGAINYLAKISNGDLRNALKLLELSFISLTRFDPINKQVIDRQLEVDESALKSAKIFKNFVNFDQKGDSHYDTISAFHKSVRGSDVDASLYYLMRMVNGGDDPLFICRRIVRIASEDIGLKDNACLIYATQVYESVLKLGLPKCLNLLIQCTIRIARSPKSIKIYRAWKNAKEFIADYPDMKIPFHLTNKQSGLYNNLDVAGETEFHYKYNLDYIDGKVRQKYLPDELLDVNLFPDHLGNEVDNELGNEQTDSEEDVEDDFYGKQNLETSDTETDDDSNHLVRVLRRKRHLKYVNEKYDENYPKHETNRLKKVRFNND